MPDKTLTLVKHLHLERGKSTTALDIKTLPAVLDVDARDINIEALKWTCALTLKRRGVETKLIIGSETASIDRALVCNIHRAKGWYQHIIDGATFTEVMTQSNTCKSRFKKILQLAFLAPDVLAKVTTGTQPDGLTSEWAKRNTLSADWAAQKALLKDR